MEEQLKKNAEIIKSYSFESVKRKIYPDIDDKTKENIVKNVDNGILLDSLVAVLDTTLRGKTAKNGLVFTLAGFYILETLEKPFYTNFSDIERIIVIPDKNENSNSSNAKIKIYLKNNIETFITNVSFKEKEKLAELIQELVEYSKTWIVKPYESISGTVKKLSLPPEIQKRCHIIIHSASAACGGVGTGVAQIPLSDTTIITPIQIGMILSLAAVFGLKITKEFAGSLLTGFAASITGRAISQVLIGWIPFFGNAINTATAAGITEAIGWSIVRGFYIDDLNNKAKYALEGQKKGYIYASAEYENKLKVQAELFETQERNAKKDKEQFEQLLDDYKDYINNLESKSDLSEGDKASLALTKIDYEKLISENQNN